MRYSYLAVAYHPFVTSALASGDTDVRHSRIIHLGQQMPPLGSESPRLWNSQDCIATAPELQPVYTGAYRPLPANRRTDLLSFINRDLPFPWSQSSNHNTGSVPTTPTAPKGCSRQQRRSSQVAFLKTSSSLQHLFALPLLVFAFRLPSFYVRCKVVS